MGGHVEDVSDLWLKFNDYANRLADALGRTSNIVGEYAEHLAHLHYGGELLPASSCSADIECAKGLRYQVKARKVKGVPTTQLSVIRSWDFDHLVVIIFDAAGRVTTGLEVPVEVAKEYGVVNDHQHGWVITTTRQFLGDPRATDITHALLALQS
jgi:hypothetical protein